MSSRPARPPRVGGPRRWWALTDASFLLALKALVSALVLAAGFTALSDDDFARVVIAQRFAEAPALDPSGTSWLPFPFWIYGASSLAFGSSLAVARATAVALGLASALAVGWAARSLGLGRVGTWAGAGLAAVFPYSALLGVAAVPEAPTAALLVIGAATLSRGPRERALGAAALFLATASRYEAWAVALVFALLTALDALRTRRPAFAASAAAAVAFPALWVLHGVARHGDPLFFVGRVSAYRAALGGAAPSFADVARAPLALVTTEPELTLACAALLALAFATGRGGELRRFARFALALGAVVPFLAAGDLRGSAPTHHAERALLAVWFGAAVVAGFALERCLAAPRSRALHAAATLTVGAALAAFALRPTRAPEAFGARRAEIDLGERARRLGVERLAIDAPDFGFFAVQAAFGRPSSTFVLDDRDPRRPSAPDRLAASPEALRDDLLRRGIRWLAAPHARATPALGTARDGNAEWSLIELGSEQGPASPRPIPHSAASSAAERAQHPPGTALGTND